MSVLSAVLQHSRTEQTLKPASALPQASSSAGTSASSSSSSAASAASSTISANDFLSLLVTEMQNQDPTADTDPNEYINQLVQVNSLEQLISINQNLTTALGSPSSSSGTTSGASPSVAATAGASSLTGPATATAQAKTSATGQSVTPVTPAAASSGSGTAAAIGRFAQSVGGGRAPGNLAVPAAQPASNTVAHALDGHRHPGTHRGQLSGTP